MKNERTSKEYSEMTQQEYRDALIKIFNSITDIRALRFFYKFVAGMVANTPCIFEKGEP